MLSTDGVYWALFAIVGLLGFGYIWLSRETPRKAMAAPADKPAPKPKPVPVDLKIADLEGHDGSVKGKDLWLAADGLVFCVEAARHFYGPGSGYSNFAGRDATIGLATMETEPSKWTKSNVTELASDELDALNDWVSRFRMKYPIVGCLNDGARPLTVAEARDRKLIE